MANELGFRCLEDWYSITADQIKQYEIPSLSKMYHNSFVLSLIATYAEKNQKEYRDGEDGMLYPWLFKSVPRNYWKEKANRKQYFDWLYLKLDLKTVEGWYTVTHHIVSSNGGAGLLKDYYGNSLLKALKDIYPETGFAPNLFSTPPNFTFENEEVIRSEIRRLEKELKFSSKQDWYRVSVKQLKALGANFLTTRGKLLRSLKLVYPEMDWDEIKLTQKGQKRAAQRWLFSCVKEILSARIPTANADSHQIGKEAEKGGGKYDIISFRVDDPDLIHAQFIASDPSTAKQGSSAFPAICFLTQSY